MREFHVPESSSAPPSWYNNPRFFPSLNMTASTCDTFVSIEICPNRPLNVDALREFAPNFCSITWHGRAYCAGDRVSCPPPPALAMAEQLRAMDFEILLHVAGRNLNGRTACRVLDKAKQIGVTGIFALQGDPSQIVQADESKCDFPYAADLVTFIRGQYGDHFQIGAAGYPETHPNSADTHQDLIYLRNKVANGVDFIITQVAFDYKVIRNFVDNCKRYSINKPILPGIYIINSYSSLMKMSTFCRTNIPSTVQTIATKNMHNQVALRNYGVHQATELIKEILSGDRSLVKGVHLFSLNDIDIAKEVVDRLELRGSKIERPLSNCYDLLLLKMYCKYMHT